MGSIELGSLSLGPEHPPIFVAEMSGNHGGSLETALAIVDAMAEAGAHALKLQTYTADTMTLNHDGPGFVVNERESVWSGERLYDLYERAHTPWDWHPLIFERCKKHGMLCFSTPFDETAVDFLESLGAPCYKISSFECTDLPLIRRVAETLKPVIISTGMASLGEIEHAVESARNAGCRDLVLLKCTSSYPAPIGEVHLRALQTLSNRFGCLVGVSDHTLGLTVPVVSVALGAVLIEKHVTLDRASATVDSTFSLEPSEVSSLISETVRAWQALGSSEIGCNVAEEKNLAYRRSVYVSRDIKTGEIFTTQNLKAVRPGFGIPPDQLKNCLGRKASKDLTFGTPMALDYISKDS